MARKRGPLLVTAQLVREALDDRWPGLSNYVQAFGITYDRDGAITVDLRLFGLDILALDAPGESSGQERGERCLTDVVHMDIDGARSVRCLLDREHEGRCV